MTSTLAWKIPWTEEPGRLQSMGSLRVRHDWATSLSLSLFTFMHWRRKWQSTPVFLPGESQGRRGLGGLPSMESHRVGHYWSDLKSSSSSFCEMSGLSLKFFSVCSKFLDVSLFRPNLFIKNDLRTRGGHFTVKPSKKSFVMVMFYCSISNLLCYLSNIIIYSFVNIIWAVR